jgi:hypothetical protein
MSRAVLDANYTLDTVQLKYQGVNWTDTANWGCNANVHPTRADAYDGISTTAPTFIIMRDMLCKTMLCCDINTMLMR